MVIAHIFATIMHLTSPDPGVVPSQMSARRATRYATDIARACWGDLDCETFLTTQAKNEGGFDHDHETCAKVGAQGEITLYQIKPEWYDGHTKEQICASNALASMLTARCFFWLRGYTKGSSKGALKFYMGVRRNLEALEERWAKFVAVRDLLILKGAVRE